VSEKTSEEQRDDVSFWQGEKKEKEPFQRGKKTLASFPLDESAKKPTSSTYAQKKRGRKRKENVRT